MSQFSNQLQAAIQQQKFTQTEVCERTGISQGQLSRYVNAENRPTPEALEKLCEIFREDQRAVLMLAYLEDDIPKSMRNLIDIEPRRSAVGATKHSPVNRSRMPEKLRAAYDHMGAAALENTSMAKTIISICELDKLTKV